jgi:hypothetical protein
MVTSALGGDQQLSIEWETIALHGARDPGLSGAVPAWFHRDFGGGKETRTGYNLFIGFTAHPPGPADP